MIYSKKTIVFFSFVGFWRLKVHRIREHRSPLNCEECGQLFKVCFSTFSNIRI